MKEREDTELAVALGWTAHLTSMVASLLSTPTRYPILHCGSRYSITGKSYHLFPGTGTVFVRADSLIKRT
jgi:hypothetical protein